jgi:hypothetical protein
METARLRDKVRDEISQFRRAIELMSTMHDVELPWDEPCVLSAPITVLQKALSKAVKEFDDLGGPGGVYDVDEYAL